MDKKTILTVEDDGILAAHLHDLLARLGYTALAAAATGEAAIEAVKAQPPDLVLMDIKLGGEMDGISAAGHIQSIANVPIVYLSGYSQDPLLQQARATAPYGYLIKPVGERELAATIEMAFYKHTLDRRLQESEEKHRLAMEATSDGLWDWNIQTGAVYFSPAWGRILGLDSVKPEYASWESRLHPEDRASVLASLQAHLEGKAERWKKEHRLQTASGAWKWVLDRGTVVARDREGKPLRLIGTAQDITEKKELESQFHQAQKLEAVGVLAGGVAHDFNNLLSVIIPRSELALMQLKEGDPLRAEIQEIQQAGERAAALTRQLLAFSRKQALQPEVLNLNQVVGNLEKMLRRLIGEDVDLVFAPAEDLGNVKADPGQVEQIIMNLSVNARDAMPGGGKLSIVTRNEELDEEYANQHEPVQPGSYVMLAVTDTGMGMDKATCERIFEPFFTTKGIGVGTGLGLSTVYGIVKQSGGYIWVYSEVGQGTTFKIYLPQVKDSPPEDRPLQTEGSVRGTETILVVEDEAAVRSLVKKNLESVGYRVLTAANGGEGLLLLECHEQPVHLMITDVVMPGISGRELARRLITISPEMKVLYMSGYPNDSIMRHGVLDEGVHFIAKPFTSAALKRKVRDVLDAAV